MEVVIFFISVLIYRCFGILNQDLTEFCQIQRRAFTKIGPLRISVTAMAGQEVNLPCNPQCGDIANPPSRKIWFRRNLNNDEQRVKLDVNTDQRKNRIFELKTHTLVIRNITDYDIDVYYCREVRDAYGGEIIEPGIYYYLDLEDISIDSAPSPEIGKMAHYIEYYMNYQRINSKIIPFYRNREARKWRIFTSWGPWGPCSTCGGPGIRRREGKCRVKRSLDWKYSRFIHKLTVKEKKLYEAQKRMNLGYSCYSRRLNELPELKHLVSRIPPFILIEVCDVTCLELYKNQWRGAYLSGYGFPFLKKPKIVENKIQGNICVMTKFEKHGVDVHLTCPGSQLNYITRWTNKSSIIQNGDDRIRVDDYGVLHIKNLQFFDKSIYTCWVNGLKTAEITLHVLKTPEIDDSTTYFIQLGIFLSILFLIWLIVSIIKFHQSKINKSQHQQTLPISPVYRTFILQKILRQDKGE